MGRVPAKERAGRWRPEVADVLIIVAGWVAVVLSAAALPVENLELRHTALFVHLICVPIGFGGVLMVNTYLVAWLLGHRTVRQVLSLTGVAHRLMAVGLGGLIASGIALDPDLHRPLMRVKLGLLLVLMLNAVRMQRSTGRLDGLSPDVAGGNVPWPIARRVIGDTVVGQAVWRGLIVIGFVMTTSGQH